MFIVLLDSCQYKIFNKFMKLLNCYIILMYSLHKEKLLILPLSF